MRIVVLGQLVAIAVAVLASPACGGSAGGNTELDSPMTPEPTPSPRELSLPSDDAPHDAPIEWWYYNGHLESEGGPEFSFHYVVFRSFDEQSGRAAEYAQMGVVDLVESEHRHHGSATVSDAAQGAPINSALLVDIDLNDFRLQIDDEGNHVIIGALPDEGDYLELQLSGSEQAMLHKGIGWMDWPFGWTYYYSYPRMKASGTIVYQAEHLEVSGEVWFDHQWGDFFVVGKPAGWQWFAIHLDDGESLMVSEVRGADGAVIATDGTLMSAAGDQQILEEGSESIVIEVLDHWISPHTGGNYPSGWRISVKENGLDMLLEPVIDDQEIPAAPFGNQAAAYWEGRVDVFASESGAMIGKGFVELSGYIDPKPLIWRTSND